MDGGAGGTRTPDPLHAMQVLSQLSYNPTIGPLIGAIPDARPVRFCLTARRASSASSIAGSHHLRLASYRGVRVVLPRPRVRPLMDAALAARLPLEVLDHVRHVRLTPVYASLVERAIQHLPRRTHEWCTGHVLAVARLLADEHEPGALGSLAEDGLRRAFP